MAEQESAPRAKPPAKRSAARKSTSASKPAAAVESPSAEPQSATKACPLCAERIQAAAVICRHCGADFRTPPSSAGTSHPAYGPPPAGTEYRPPSQGAAFGPPSAGTNGFAIAALVLGILWLWGVGSILAVIFGHIAKRQLREARARGQFGGGDGMATAGLVLGYIGIAGAILITIALVSVGSSTSCGTYGTYC